MAFIPIREFLSILHFKLIELIGLRALTERVRLAEITQPAKGALENPCPSLLRDPCGLYLCCLLTEHGDYNTSKESILLTIVAHIFKIIILQWLGCIFESVGV